MLNLEQLCQWPLLGVRLLLIEGISAGNGVWGDLLEIVLCMSCELALIEPSLTVADSFSFHVALAESPELLRGPTFPRAGALAMASSQYTLLRCFQ